MSCTLCNDTIIKSGTLRPNVATFECGHEFHLSCTLKYSRENISMRCPICNEVKTSHLNLGEDRMIALQSLIDARRNYKEETSKGILSWFTNKSIKSMVKSGTSLDTLKTKGVTPEDIIEERMDWETMSTIYKTSALLEFGFRWHHMITMGFQPDHFKKLSWHQMTDVLSITATDMLKTSLTIRQLAELKLDIAHLHELGFKLKELREIGGNCETMKLITNSLSDIETYFNPTQSEMESMGFTKKAMQEHDWEVKEFKAVKKLKPIKLKSGFVF
jgi:transcription elongation factor Elf1